MKQLLAAVAVATLLLAPSAAGRSEHATVVQKAKQRYYHANGYLKAIGKNARRTIYHPNRRIRTRWQKAVRYLIHVKHAAWQIMHPKPVYQTDWLYNDFLCIHKYEGAWNANTGNGYYGGEQMDYGFMSTYGPEFLHSLGTADRWPPNIQILVAERAYRSGRGFGPWPETARKCRLL